MIRDKTENIRQDRKMKMKWINAVLQTKLMLLAVILSISSISFQTIRFNEFDWMTILILALIMGLYLFVLYIWKQGKEIIGQRKNE